MMDNLEDQSAHRELVQRKLTLCVSLSLSVYLDLPQGVGAGRRGRRLPQRGSEEHVQFALVLVAGEELLLLGVKQTHHVALKEKKTCHGGSVVEFTQELYFPPFQEKNLDFLLHLSKPSWYIEHKTLMILLY